MKVLPEHLVFILIAIGLAVFFGYEGYLSNSSLAKSEELFETLRVSFIVGSFFIVPLLIASACCFKVHPKNLPWLSLILLCIGAIVQWNLFNNFLYIFIWPANVFLAIKIAVNCFSLMGHSPALTSNAISEEKNTPNNEN